MKRFIFAISICVLACLLCSGAVASAETVKVADGVGFSSSAQSAIVMERSSNRVLFEQNADAHLPMASTTKIVTALTVINHANLDDLVEVSPKAVGIEGSSVYLRTGEHLTVKELLYGLMLRSGNDCAVALALHVAGSIESFAEMMNETAKELGCVDCHFANPHGLHDEQHYTSARDLATLTCAALSNADFQEIVATKSMRISNEGMEYDRLLVNKNKLLTNFDDADGVKTGYTKKAGRCFVGSATRNGMQVVVVVLNCGPMFEETADMLNVAFANYSLQCIIPRNKICGSRIENGKRVYYTCPQGFNYPVKNGEEVTTEINFENETPTISAQFNGKTVFEQELARIK